MNKETLVKNHIRILKDMCMNDCFVREHKKNFGTTSYAIKDMACQCILFNIINDKETITNTASTILKYIDKRKNIIKRRLKEKKSGNNTLHNDLPNSAIKLISENTNLIQDNNMLTIHLLIELMQKSHILHDDSMHASSIHSFIEAGEATRKLETPILHSILKNSEHHLEMAIEKELNEKVIDTSLIALAHSSNRINKKRKEKILDSISDNLTVSEGVVKYKGEFFYHNNQKKPNMEAILAHSWLSIAYTNINNKKSAKKNEFIALTNIFKDENARKKYAESFTDMQLEEPQKIFAFAMNELMERHAR